MSVTLISWTREYYNDNKKPYSYCEGCSFQAFNLNFRRKKVGEKTGGKTHSNSSHFETKISKKNIIAVALFS